MIKNIQNSFYADSCQTWLVLQLVNIVFSVAQTIEEAPAILISYRFSEEEEEEGGERVRREEERLNLSHGRN